MRSMGLGVSAWTLLMLCLPCAMGNLLISQVVEGSSYNKVAVISNRGTFPVDTRGYAVRVGFNGRGWASRGFPLDGVLQPGEAYYICNSRVAREWLEYCDELENQLNFNGNDAIGLFKDGKLIDKFGDETGMGLGKGSKGFEINGVPKATQDNTILRLDEVTSGTSDWEESSRTQWSILPQDSLVTPQGRTVTLTGGSGSEDTEGPGTPVLRPTAKEPTLKRKGKVVVGTFNVEWLYDGVKDVSMSPYRNNPEAAQKHLSRIAQIIGKIDPDIMNLAEVEDEKVLNSLVSEAGNGMEGFFVQGTDTFLGQDVALISKVRPTSMSRTDGRANTPVEGSQCGFNGKSDTSVSKNYFATFDDQKIFPFKFAMVGAHFKAIPTKPSACAKREGQAAVLQRVIKNLISEGYEVVVLGDLNDYSDLFKGIADFSPTSKVLSMLRDPDNDGEDELRNVLEIIPVKQRYTAHWDRNRNDKVDGDHELSAIDHILLTKKLWDRVERAWVLDDHDPAVVSDHWPLMVELKTDIKDEL